MMYENLLVVLTVGTFVITLLKLVVEFWYWKKRVELEKKKVGAQ